MPPSCFLASHPALLTENHVVSCDKLEDSSQTGPGPGWLSFVLPSGWVPCLPWQVIAYSCRNLYRAELAVGKRQAFTASHYKVFCLKWCSFSSAPTYLFDSPLPYTTTQLHSSTQLLRIPWHAVLFLDSAPWTGLFPMPGMPFSVSCQFGSHLSPPGKALLRHHSFSHNFPEFCNPEMPWPKTEQEERTKSIHCVLRVNIFHNMPHILIHPFTDLKLIAY